MTDRTPTKVLKNGAVRYGVYDESGTLLRYEYIRKEDDPKQIGTALNKATLLKDETANKLGLTQSDPTVDDAFNALFERTASVAVKPLEWRPATLPSTAIWSDAAYGNGKFVVVSGLGANPSNKAAYSTDGINWNASALPHSAAWGGVAYGNGKFVAVEYTSGKMAYSSDAVTWTSASSPYKNAGWYSVAYGDGKFVAVAGGTTSHAQNDKAAYSIDGVIWTGTTLPSVATWSSVAYGNGKFVAVSSDGNQAAYSTDGINWRGAELPEKARWDSVVYGGGRFVATTLLTWSTMVGLKDHVFAVSFDGTSWDGGYKNDMSNLDCVAYGNGIFVAPDFMKTRCFQTNDGFNWVKSSMPSEQQWSGIAYGNRRFVVVARNSDQAFYALV